MTAAELVSRLREHGAILAVSDRRRLRIIAMGDELPDDLLAEVTRLKGDIVKLVTGYTARREPERPRGGASWPAAIGDARRETGAFTRCVICQGGTWARYAGAGLCERDAGDHAAGPRLEFFFAVSRWWQLTAEGASHEIVVEAHRQIVRLSDDVGEPLASELRARWARAWQHERGRCPRCGGVPHASEEEA